MSDNRGQDIKLIKLAIKVEKDATLFFDRFMEKTGEGKLGEFLRQINEEVSVDMSRFEALLQALETGQDGNIENLSLDDYTRESNRGEKFFPPSRISELLDGFFNPIQVLEACSQIVKDLSNFYLESATNIYYETEKNAFIEIADHKKEVAETIERKKREIISRFP